MYSSSFSDIRLDLIPPPFSNNHHENGYLNVSIDSGAEATFGAATTEKNRIMSINVGGSIFQTFYTTVEKWPKSLLGNPLKRQRFFVNETGSFFFDRRPDSFGAILHYYETNGMLKRPVDVPFEDFLNELIFFQLGPDALEQFWTSEGLLNSKHDETCKQPVFKTGKTRFLKGTIWNLLNCPESSPFARAIAVFSTAVILVATASLCLETIPGLQHRWYSTNLLYVPYAAANNTTATVENSSIASTKEQKGYIFLNAFFIVETLCIIWFLFELVLRVLVAPAPKLEFFTKSFLNFIDLLAILAYVVGVILLATKTGSASSGVVALADLRILRLFRCFRVLMLGRYSRGLRVLGKTIRASAMELVLILFVLFIAVILFATALYVVENQTHPNSGFHSIPEACWYAIITMTTVGYGDLAPLSVWGKLVGSACAVSGVLLLALPVPLIATNFKHHYRSDQRSSELRKLRQKLHQQEDNEEAKNLQLKAIA